MKEVSELLKPRWKVINDFPLMNKDVKYYGESFAISGKMFYSKDFPGILQPLPWYAERKEDEMPQYVKLEWNKKIQYIHKVESWKGENYIGQPLYEYYNKVNYLSTACVSDLLPATQSEYETYINSKK
jgi:hypothetical protein